MSESVWKSGFINGVLIESLSPHSDERGLLCELWRKDDPPALPHPAMAYLSMTRPGQARGPHEHRYQTDLFAFCGPGTVQVTLWDAREHSPSVGVRMSLSVGEDHPVRMLVPPGVVHGYQNLGTKDALVVNMPDCLYKGEHKTEPVDEIRHETQADSPFVFPSNENEGT